MPHQFTHDPQEKNDYAFDWSQILAVGEAILTHDVSVSDDSLTVDTVSHTDSIVVYWVSDGVSGQRYMVTCHVSTNLGRELERSARFLVNDR
ncbi:phage fiber-tail adaptor protein [Angustibacter luteus]|uniref:Halobacterial output domain-containing protein n=1 Tax=Angustibacter luteus TaxID=658456 RepID=A0ABW1JIY2_9ACTN